MRCEIFNISNITFLISSGILGFAVLLSFSLFSNVLVTAENTDNSIKPLTATSYINILRLRRIDHKSFVQSMLKSDYAKNYKIIALAVEKIFHIFENSNQTLTERTYSPKSGFPTDVDRQEAVISILENCCLISDIILHFPEISYRILKKKPNWKPSINWCIGFVNLFPQITDESIVELMDLVRQEINEEQRTEDYINPYYAKTDTVDTKVKKKPKQKKLKKGPVLNKQEL